jgi:hypothetical protein
MKGKKRFFASHSKSSALVVSVVIHVVLIAVALSYVAVNVLIKEDPTFEAAPVKRPKMKLKKLTIPVNIKKKKIQKPKLRKNIVSKPKTKSVVLKMPEMVGIKGGTGYLANGGLGSLGFDMEIPDLFGSNKRGKGNEFVGQFYDLKQTKDGRITEIGELVANAKSTDFGSDPDLKASSKLYKEVVRRFLSGWNASILKRYFKAPQEKFATTFMIPKISADEAPKAFGVEKQVKPMKWLALYQGQISAPETGKYRFCGRADDIMAVRVKKRLVLDASFMNASGWESEDPNNKKYEMYSNSGVVIGDWILLQKDKPVPMEVLIGEEPGGVFFCQLYIEQEGVDYPVRTEQYEKDKVKETLQRPILPIFKTADFSDKMVEQMKVNPNWATVEGPNFGIIK